MTVTYDFGSKTAIVTGGSRGIGKAIVHSLASSGARVAFSYATNETSARETLKNLPGEGHFIVPMKLEDPESITSASEHVMKEMGTLEGLVNNAGLTRDGLLLRMKIQDWDDVITANLRGTFLSTQSFLRYFMKARRGSIVNMTSVIARTGNPGQANYAASKAGIIGFTKSLAKEIASRGVRGNCVAPGFVKTDMTSSLSADVQADILRNIPLGYVAEAEDIAVAVKFLLQPESHYITGHTLDINGGMYSN